jgi:serine/threonine protein kinase
MPWNLPKPASPWRPKFEGWKQTSPNWQGTGGLNYKYHAISPPMTKANINKYHANLAYSPSKNAWNMSCGQLKASFKSFKVIGKGRQGIVFGASKHAGIKHPFAVKIAPRDLFAKKRGEPQPVDVEYNIQNSVQKLAPNVVRVYKNMRCVDFINPTQINMPNVQNSTHHDKSQQGILIMEFAGGGSLDSWLKKTKQLDDEMMSHLISDILGALFAIQKKYPDFRHNDLHMQNVFVADRGFLIGDFGWSRLKKMGTNPAVNTANGTKTASFWGVGPKTDDRYDHHLFLNELLYWAMKNSPDKHPKAIEFLKKAVPEGYRGKTNLHVTQWRLKYGDPCLELPPLAKLMKDPFLGGKRNVTSPNLKAVKAALKPVRVKRISSINLIKAKAKLKAPKKVTSLQLRKAKEKLKRVARPKPKPRITGYNLRAAKARLRKIKVPSPPKKAPSPPKKKVKIPPAILKTAKFDKLVEKIWKNAGSATGANFQNAWNSARMKAISIVENSLRKNKPPFSPSPPKPMKKLPSPLSPLGPPPKNLNAAAARMRQRAANLAAKRPKLLMTHKVPSPNKPKPKLKPNNSNFKLSPSSGRAKVKSNSSGRWVYANLHYSMDELKALAGKKGVNIKGLRSKANIAKKIFT